MADDILDELAQPDEPLDLKIQKALKKDPRTLADMAASLGATPGAVLDEILAMRDRGVNLVELGDRWSLEKQPLSAIQQGRTFEYVSRPDGTYVFGCSSDKHLGSKYERLDVMRGLYDWFADAGADRVFDAGNMIEGESRFNKFDIAVYGLEQQADYLVEHLPNVGLDTYAVHGDDHEGWYGQREAVDIGRFLESKMEAAGRTDWHDLGFMEAKVDLVHAHSGARTGLLIMHPGGGSAYAHSYKPQKIVESFQGGEKPAVLLIGHYHKLSANLIRNVWALQIGCSQDQTPFMRKKGIEPAVGGMLVTLHQDPRTGAITQCLPEMRQYFVKGYYNDRFSKATRTPVLPTRTVGGA